MTYHILTCWVYHSPCTRMASSKCWAPLSDSWVEYPYPIWFFDHHSHVLTCLGDMIYIYIYSLGDHIFCRKIGSMIQVGQHMSQASLVTTRELWFIMVPVPLANRYDHPKIRGAIRGRDIKTRGQSELDIVRPMRFSDVRLLQMCSWEIVCVTSNWRNQFNSSHTNRVKTKNPTNQPTEPGIMSSSSGASESSIFLFAWRSSKEFDEFVFPVSFNVSSTMGFITMKFTTHFWGGTCLECFFSNHWTSNTSTSQRRRVVRWLASELVGLWR